MRPTNGWIASAAIPGNCLKRNSLIPLRESQVVRPGDPLGKAVAISCFCQRLYANRPLQISAATTAVTTNKLNREKTNRCRFRWVSPVLLDGLIIFPGDARVLVTRCDCGHHDGSCRGWSDQACTAPTHLSTSVTYWNVLTITCLPKPSFCGVACYPIKAANSNPRIAECPTSFDVIF